MAYEEIALEQLVLARETVRGTKVTPPTVRFPIAGVLTPSKTVFRSEDQVGELEEYQRSEVMHRGAQYEGSGSFDVRRAPFLMAMLVKGGVTPTTPASAVLTRRWSYTPTITSDDLSSATAYWGDPNVEMLQSGFMMIDEMTIETNADSDESTSWGIKATAQDPGAPLTGGGIPALPSTLLGPLLIAQNLEVQMDTSSAIGTTTVTGRVISAKHVIPGGIEYKYTATGPGGGTTFTHIGRKARHISTTLVLEVPDLTEYNLWKAHTTVKCRVTHYGPLIENAGGTDFFYYLRVDTYGPLDGFTWGDVRGTNRTIEVTIESEKDATLGASWRVEIQNKSTTEIN